MKIHAFVVVMVMALPAAAAEDWGPAGFLVGRWTGAGTGQPGQGIGSFSFTPDLQGKILVRKSFAEYPAAEGKPAFRHDDLMIVYHDDNRLQAIYFDSENHVIRYAVEPAGNGVAFVSDTPPSVPRYRLTYTRAGKDSVRIKFDVAPPGKEFATYIEADARRDQ